MDTRPESTTSRPDMQLRRVVFPEPDGPITATISPRITLRSTPCNAFTERVRDLYVLTNFSATMIGS